MAAAAAAARVAGAPAVRLSSRLQVATSFIPQPPPASSATRRRGGPAAALTADVRVVIRRHFPVAGPRGGGGGATRIVQVVAEDIALRRRPARELRAPERVARALAEDVLPRVAHPFDRGAVATAGGEICARAAAACADPRAVAACAVVRVLVVVDTFACPVVPLRPWPPAACKPTMWSGVAAGVKDAIARAEGTCTGLEPAESGLPIAKEQRRHVGVIGERRRAKPVGERFQGWLPW